MSNEIKIKKGIWKHFKGKEYRVLGIARHSETLEVLVIYQALYETKEFGKDAIWVRPITMWSDLKEKDGQKVPRFEFVKEE